MFRLCVALILVLEITSLVLLSLFVSETPALLLSPLVLVTIVLAFVLYPKFGGFSYRAWRLTPEKIAGHKPQDQDDSRTSQENDPIFLSRSIVERTTEIRRAMLASPSEAEVEICALGYHACVNDMITLTHIANEELPNAGILRRMKLNRSRRRATEALSGARAALPPEALRTRHQEKQ